MAEYFVIPGDNKTFENTNIADGYGYFVIQVPHVGQVTVNRSLDYERTQKYLVTIVASVSYILISIFLYACSLYFSLMFFLRKYGEVNFRYEGIEQT